MITNPLLNKICINCRKNGMECQCDSFHPVIEQDKLELDRSEAQMLYLYFLNCGYIGFELERDIAAHKFVKKLREFLK